MDANKINKFKTDIKELNNTSLLNLENYAQVYFNTLSNPNNTMYKNELTRKNNILEQVDSDALLLQNQMTSLINKMTYSMNISNTKIERLKKENELLQNNKEELHKDVLTSDGLFGGELEWYREQVKVVIIMILGIIVCSIMFYRMNLTFKDKMIAFILVLIFGTIFTYIANYIWK